MHTLIGEYFSPWSEKARWALDHHAIPYTYREHVPLLGEPLLRVRARRLTGRVSVPMLLTPDGPVADSFAIARHAEAIGRGAELFPRAHDVAIASWNARSEAALAAARALYLGRVAASYDAKVEMQPPFLPEAMRRGAVPVADLAIAFLRRKYAVPGAAAAELALEEALDALRAALGAAPRHVLGETLTYADIAMAVTLQFVSPVDLRYIPLGPATRAACVHDALATKYADLVAWRDALYARHRRTS